MITVTVKTAPFERVMLCKRFLTISGALCWVNDLQRELSDYGAYRFVIGGVPFDN